LTAKERTQGQEATTVQSLDETAAPPTTTATLGLARIHHFRLVTTLQIDLIPEMTITLVAKREDTEMLSTREKITILDHS